MKKFRVVTAWILTVVMMCINVDYIQAETMEGLDSIRTERTTDANDIGPEKGDEEPESVADQDAPEEVERVDTLDTASGENIASGTWRGMDWVIDADGVLTISGTYQEEVSEDPFPAWVLTDADVFTYDIEYYYPKGLVYNPDNHISQSAWNKIKTVTVTAENVTSTAWWFSFGNFESVDLSKFDTSKVTDMSYMFHNSTRLSNLDLSHCNTSNVTNMTNMFSKCWSLTKLDLSHWDTSNVQNMEGMFRGCRTTSLDLSHFDTGNVQNMKRMFQACNVLTCLDLSHFDMRKVTEQNIILMINGCNAGWLKTCKNLPLNKASSAGYFSKEMYDSNGNKYEELPWGVPEGIWLYADLNDIEREPLTCAVTFAVNGGAALTADQQSRIVKANTVYGELPVPTRADYRFDGWFTKADGGEQVTAETICTRSVTLYAHWTATYTVIFDVNGGETLAADQQIIAVAQNTAYGELPVPTRSDYTFAGWFTKAEGGKQVTAKTICTGNVTLYAHWTSLSDPQPKPDRGLEIGLADEAEIYTYTGMAIRPEIEVIYNGEALVDGVDYSVKYTNNVNANTDVESAKAPTITVTCKGNFTGSDSLAFAIEQKNLETDGVMAADIATDSADKTKPAVYYNGMLLKLNKDYTYTTKDSSEEGVAKVFEIKGQGNYSGTIEQRVIVKEKKALGKFTAKTVIPDKNAIVYDGSEQSVKVEVTDSKDKTKILEEHIDYELVWGNNVNAGAATVTVIGTGDYTGTKKLKFTIKPADNAKVIVSNLQASYTYQGTAVTIGEDLIVTDAQGSPLTQGVDYKLAYSANKKPGKAKCKVTFLGNYKGTKAYTVDYVITNGVISDDVSGLEIIVGPVEYNGKAGAYKSNVHVTLNGIALKKSDYTVNYYKDASYTQEIKTKADYITLEEDEYEKTVYVKVTGRGNFAPIGDGSDAVYATQTYEVVQNTSFINISKAKITVLDESGNKLKKSDYTGEPITPQIKVEYKHKDEFGKMVTEETDWYCIYYQNNVDKGKATIVITGDGIESVGSKTITFTIASRKVK